MAEKKGTTQTTKDLKTNLDACEKLNALRKVLRGEITKDDLRPEEEAALAAELASVDKALKKLRSSRLGLLRKLA